ncbi:MAG: hypothetical protein ACR2RB_02430 [Gammaproteobacteria bacterium]
MKRFLLSFILLATFPLINSIQATESGHSHKHEHSQIDVSALTEKPSVSLNVARDTVGGWNIHVKTRNFRFAPENASREPVSGEGHAHLYVDGKKVSRLYGAWFHLGELSPGRHEIRVTLNANDHASLVLHGEPVAASTEIIQ